MTRWNAYKQLVLTRFRIFYREPAALFWVYGFPILMAIGLGLAFSSAEPEPPEVDIVGQPGESQAKNALASLKKAKFKKAKIYAKNEAFKRLATGKTALVIIPIDKGYKYRYDTARQDSVLARHWVESVLLRASDAELPITEVDAVEEPGTRYIDFLIPGLLGLNLLGGGLFGIGFTIVDMRVRKLLKRMMATPMNRSDFMLAIMTARLCLLVPDVGVLLLVGHYGFNVPIHGSLLLLFLIIIIGSAAFSGIGLFLACRTEKLEVVSGLMNLLMLPMWIMSGTFFDSGRFPKFMQPFIQALPLTQVNSALREVMLQNYGLDQIAWRLAILLAWAVITFALALWFFRWR